MDARNFHRRNGFCPDLGGNATGGRQDGRHHFAGESGVYHAGILAGKTKHLTTGVTKVTGTYRANVAYAPISFSSAALLRIKRVEPRKCANSFSRNSPSTRVTVSREVPMS